jgi:hypothetical protein
VRRWRCHLLSILRIHYPNCENCNFEGSRQVEDMRARLEELRTTAPRSEAPVQMDAPPVVFELASRSQPFVSHYSICNGLHVRQRACHS